MFGGAVAQLGARLDGIEEVVGSNPIGSTILHSCFISTFSKVNHLAATMSGKRRIWKSELRITTQITRSR